MARFVGIVIPGSTPHSAHPGSRDEAFFIGAGDEVMERTIRPNTSTVHPRSSKNRLFLRLERRLSRSMVPKKRS